MFTAAASFAGAMDANPEDAETAADARIPSDPVNNVYHWASANKEQIKSGLGLYLFVGGEDRLYARNAAFVEYLHGGASRSTIA
ncbi:MAG: hypothetical protein R2724_13305 [Bryobacterales bacterium]